MPKVKVDVDSPARLDIALLDSDQPYSRSRWRKIIEQGRVTINGQPVSKSGAAVQAGDLLEIDLPDEPATTIVPTAMDLEVLYQDPQIVVLNKPAGLIVHPGVQNEPATLVHGLVQHFPDLAETFQGPDAKRPGIVHRLDKGTSGVMVVARTEAARRHLVAQFQERRVEKVYNAWVFGIPQLEGEWDGPIARHPKNRKKFAVVAHGKPARTAFAVVARSGQSSKLKILLHTGRTHQIRVHACHAGFPLLGDPTYSRKQKISAKFKAWRPERDRPALHAASLTFKHPDSEAEVHFVAPLPLDLQGLDQLYDPV